jgi:hypothetical protein
MIRISSLIILLVMFLLTYQKDLSAHCDGEDGPVITSARKALEDENVNLVLVWVQKNDEKDVIEVYEKTLTVRKLGPSARELADKHFFETVVRLHRMGEGASYTGIKPAGYNNDPSVQAADRSVEVSQLKDLYTLLSEEIHNGLHSAYEEVEALKSYDRDDVEAGRKFVAAYVNFLHYVEGIYKAAKTDGEGHAH